jgi:hypothetical protein
MPVKKQTEAVSPVDPQVFDAVEAVLPSAYERLLKDHRAISRLTFSRILGMQKGVGPEEIHRLGLCEQATRWMVSNLVIPGHEVNTDTASVGSRSRDIAQNPMLASIPSNRMPHIPIPDRPTHTYPVIGDMETGLVADLVWQQFLPDKLKNDNDFPKTLIGTRSAIRERAHDYGVSDVALGFWLPPSQRQVSTNEHLTAA